MNVHSHHARFVFLARAHPVSPASSPILSGHASQPGHLASVRRVGTDERAAHILAAAERCFARTGFHRTTMNDIAREAGMSAGNLYRYFVSKDEVVAQLCAKDRADIGQGFMAIIDAPDPFVAFEALGRHHLVNEPRERAIVTVEIWAEAARNPRVAEMTRAFDADIRARLTGFLEGLATRGLAKPGVDYAALIQMVMVLVDGVISNRARCPNFDPAPFIERMSAMVRLGVSGGLPVELAPLTPTAVQEQQ
jgi:TetR/AcrR family transcriptional regulator, repressor for uid operon